jgi:hypothetical protein
MFSNSIDCEIFNQRGMSFEKNFNFFFQRINDYNVEN